jgi:hypothetical protein
MVQHYFFSNILTYTINTLLFGTALSYLIYFFSFKNQYQNIIKYDTIYNLIKIILTITLGLSYVIFMLFLYYFYTYHPSASNYNLFNSFTITPVFYLNFFLV